MKNGEDEAIWNTIPITGKSPGMRYGHTMCYMKPYIVVFGGNTGNHPTNDVWIISLEKSPFQWSKLEFSDQNRPSNSPPPMPTARLYHASGVCTKGNAQGMMIIFGGRDQSENALNDTWGLRRHRSGNWDWIVAPYKGDIVPKNRYNVTYFLYLKLIKIFLKNQRIKIFKMKLKSS